MAITTSPTTPLGSSPLKCRPLSLNFAFLSPNRINSFSPLHHAFSSATTSPLGLLPRHSNTASRWPATSTTTRANLFHSLHDSAPLPAPHAVSFDPLIRFQFGPESDDALRFQLLQTEWCRCQWVPSSRGDCSPQEESRAQAWLLLFPPEQGEVIHLDLTSAMVRKDSLHLSVGGTSGGNLEAEHGLALMHNIVVSQTEKNVKEETKSLGEVLDTLSEASGAFSGLQNLFEIEKLQKRLIQAKSIAVEGTKALTEKSGNVLDSVSEVTQDVFSGLKNRADQIDTEKLQMRLIQAKNIAVEGTKALTEKSGDVLDSVSEVSQDVFSGLKNRVEEINVEKMGEKLNDFVESASERTQLLKDQGSNTLENLHKASEEVSSRLGNLIQPHDSNHHTSLQFNISFLEKLKMKVSLLLGVTAAAIVTSVLVDVATFNWKAFGIKTGVSLLWVLSLLVIITK